MHYIFRITIILQNCLNLFLKLCQMSKFVPILFIGFLLSIGLHMAFLSNELDKCLELKGSPIYKEMIKKLLGQLPKKKSEYEDIKILYPGKEMSENKVSNYSDLLKAMKDLMELKHKEEIIHTSDQTGRRIQDFVNILGEECVIATGCFRNGKRTETVENVLNEALKCAVEVNQFIKQNNGPETGKKLFKKWFEMDEYFEKVLQAIWVLYEPDQQFYTECHKLVTDLKFEELIRALRQKFPINKGEKDNGINAEGKMDYAKLLSAIKGFIAKMEDFDDKFKVKRSAVKFGYIVTTKKYKEHQMKEIGAILSKSDMYYKNTWEDTNWLINERYAVTTIKYQNLTVSEIYQIKHFKDLLEGLLLFLYRVNGEWVQPTVKSELNEVLKCASVVHEFTENMKSQKKGGHENLGHENLLQHNWFELDGKFEQGLQQIWILEAEDAGKMAAAGEMNAKANA